jgi:serine/threonine protein kinase
VKLEDFRIIESIGKGSYGKVYVAEKNRKKYAIKELSKDYIS